MTASTRSSANARSSFSAIAIDATTRRCRKSLSNPLPYRGNGFREEQAKEHHTSGGREDEQVRHRAVVSRLHMSGGVHMKPLPEASAPIHDWQADLACVRCAIADR